MTQTNREDIHAGIAAEQREWMRSQPKFIAVDLPVLPGHRTGLTGRTITIERDPATRARVAAERFDGRLVTVHQVDDSNGWDEQFVISTDELAYDVNATFIKDALQLPLCPAWCAAHGQHMFPNDTHYGIGAFLDLVGNKSGFIIAMEQDPDGAPKLVYRPYAADGGELTLTAAKELRATLGQLICSLENMEGQQ